MATKSRFGGRKVREGTVVSDKMQKTVVVAVEAHFRHPLYKKTVRRIKRYMAHDEADECRVGDRVRILESRPLSRRKRWRVVEVISRAELPEVAAESVDLELLGEVKPKEPPAAQPTAAAEAPAPAEAAPAEAAPTEVAPEEPPAVEEAAPAPEAPEEAPAAVAQPEEAPAPAEEAEREPPAAPEPAEEEPQAEAPPEEPTAEGPAPEEAAESGQQEEEEEERQ